MISNIGITKSAHISRRKFDTIFDCFVSDTSAKQASSIARVNYNTAKRYYNLFRDLIIKESITERASVNLSNGIELDESYFGPTRVRGKRGRGAGNKTIVFGLLKRKGKVYTEIISGASRLELMPIIRKVVKSGSDIYTDGWRSYDALGIYGYNHKKVKHEENEFVKDKETHINGVESFWSWTKQRLIKFNGLTKGQFKQYLLESEWRFNHRKNLRKDLRKMLRNF
jgi:transposase-like protein